MKTKTKPEEKVEQNGTAIVPVETKPVGWTAIRNLQEAIQVAEIVAKSNAFPDVRNMGIAVVKIMAGNEMGFGPFASLVDVHIIEGKPSIGAHLRAAAIKRSGRYDYRILRLDREACELEFFEHGTPIGKVGMTLKEAVDSGLAMGKGGIKTNWARTPDDMLFARCISKGYRRYCPDLSGGVLAYDPDEMDRAEAPPPPAPPAEILDAEIVPQKVGDQQTDSPLPITDEQYEKMNALIKSLGLTAEQVAAGLNRYGVDSALRMTSFQAEEAIGKLEAALAKKAQTPGG